MKCAIHQPQFLPWLGHFHKIGMADVFVFLDNVQFRKNEFQNRNRIPAPNGAQWLTVPVSFRFGDELRAVRIAEGRTWRRKILGAIEHEYGRTPHYVDYVPALAEMLGREWRDLASLNMATVHWLMDCFGIATQTVVASELPDLSPDRTGRLVDICRRVGATTYISGAQARCYLDVNQFAKAGLAVQFQAYRHPVYAQAKPGRSFVSHMSAIDGLFTCGGGPVARRKLNLDDDHDR